MAKNATPENGKPPLTVQRHQGWGTALFLALGATLASIGPAGAAPAGSLVISVAGGGTVSIDGTATHCTRLGGANCSVALAAGSHTLTAVADSGYAFAGWYSNTTAAGLNFRSQAGNPYSITKSAGNQHVTAIFAPTAATGPAPVQVYQDILSGPLVGGENDKGIYLSVFGRNFGGSGLGSTVKMYVDNIEVNNYRLLQASRGRTDIDQLTVQLGALGAAGNGTPLPIMVVVDGRIAADPRQLTFTPNPGNIYFVSNSGTDTADTSTGGTFAAPFKTVQKPGFGLSFAIQPASVSGAYGRVRAGDFIVLRGGTYTTVGFDGYFMQTLNKSGCPIGSPCAQGGGTTSGPITVMGYPGETAFIDRTYASGDTFGGGFSSADSARQGNGYGAWWTLTNLKIESGFSDGPVNTQRGELNPLGSHWRVVNNEMTAFSCALQTVCKAGGVAGNGDGNYWVGNYIHDVNDQADGNTDFENHGVYIDGAGSYEVAYNRFVNIVGGNGVQTNNNGSPTIANVAIHHNLINGTGKHGINIADATTGVVIHDNVVMHTDVAGLRFNSDALSGAKVYNNTFYDTDRLDVCSGVRAALQNDSAWAAGAAQIVNNIFVAGKPCRYLTGGTMGVDVVAAAMSNNLWYSGQGDTPGSGNVLADPRFANTGSGAEDLHLLVASPARNAGSSSVASVVTDDYDISTRRPLQAAYDIGAYEFDPGPLPDPPILLRLVPMATAMRLLFAAPATPVTSYVASCTGNGTTRTATGSGSPITVTGLTRGVSYACSVRAVNANGSSGESARLTKKAHPLFNPAILLDTAQAESSSPVACDITIVPSSTFAQLEAVSPGQTVCIAPGTYHFRVWLNKAATADHPITIRALDPAQRPVFDYTGWTHGWVDGVPPFPGSYMGNDAYRSAWRVDGSHYTIDGIIIQNANNAGNPNFDNTAGLRYLNSSHLTVRNCRFFANDMGIQGGGSNTIIEYSEFDRNGYEGSDQSHNIYILGGDNFTLRYSYAHDSIGGQNFHIRARNATLAYNWFQNAADYEGDMMTNQANYDPGITGIQNLLLLGNVFVQNAAPANQTKFITLYNDDSSVAKPTFNLTALWNTFIFNDTYPYGAGVIKFSTATLAGGNIVFSNNVVAGVGATTARAAIITDGGSGALSSSGSSNFFLSGFAGQSGNLTASIIAADPKFADPQHSNYSLQTSSLATGLAATSASPSPGYYPAPLTPAAVPTAIRTLPRAGISNPGAMQP